jgi:hypothetical protein
MGPDLCEGGEQEVGGVRDGDPARHTEGVEHPHVRVDGRQRVRSLPPLPPKDRQVTHDQSMRAQRWG